MHARAIIMMRHAISFLLLVVVATLLSLSAVGFASADADFDRGPPRRVTCGSLVKLRNQGDGRHVHSLEMNYGTGSGQQAVLGTTAGDSAESMWIVRNDGTEPCPQGTAIKSGFTFRLQHSMTGKWLHSHLHRSPLSGNQEVSCYGGGSGNESDGGDLWIVEFDGNEWWFQDQPVRIKHRDTGAFLGSHKKEYGRPIAGYSEIYAAKGKGKGTEHAFMATDGVYF